MAERKDLVRPARTADLPGILAIANEAIRSHHANFHWVERPLAELEGEFAATAGAYPWLVAVEDRGLLGFAKAGPFRAREAYRWTAEVAVYLDAAARRRGLGRALYERLLADLAVRGYRAAIGAIALPNEASEGLHGALGFERVGVLPEVGWKGGRWIDVALWQRVLRGAPAGD